MKPFALFALILCLVACSENSPLNVAPTPAPTSAVTIENGALAYLIDTLGMREAKIVFRNDTSANLVYVRITKDSVQSFEFSSDLDVYHPTISPDGKWVAFGTSPEPIGSYSEVYIQELSPYATGRILVAAPGAIPRFRVLPSGDTVLIYVSSGRVNREDSKWISGWTKMVKFSNGRIGMPEKILTGNYHGGVSDDLRLAVTGSHFLRVHSELTPPPRDTVWYDSSQVCNVSLSTDGSLRTLFLDLGAERGQEFSGTFYFGHTRILIADSLGNLIESIPSPEPYSFEHPEWVYGSDRFVSVVLGEFHEKVALLNVQDSSVHALLSGLDFWHPDIYLAK